MTNAMVVCLVIAMPCEDCCAMEYDGTCTDRTSRCNVTYNCGTVKDVGCVCKTNECNYSIYRGNCNSFEVNKKDSRQIYTKYCECKLLPMPYYVLFGICIPTCLLSACIASKSLGFITIVQPYSGTSNSH